VVAGEFAGKNGLFTRCAPSKYMSLKPRPAAPQLLAGKKGRAHTLFTYHRTWETGVGHGHEGRRIQPFIIFQHLSLKLSWSTIVFEEFHEKIFLWSSVCVSG
jgi:hypothetical protein